MIGRDNFTGPRASLIARDVERLQRALDSGLTTRQAAYVMGIDRRTAYRYRHARIAYVSAFGEVVALVQWAPGTPPRIIDQRRRTA